MFSLSLRHVAAAAIALTSLSAAAQDRPANAPAPAAASTKGFQFVGNAGFTFGGDTIAVAQYTNGTDQKINAGGMLEFGFGGIYEANDLPIAAQLTANYHVNDTDATNGTMRFHRFPIEGMLYFTGVEQWRFGVGVRAVQSPRYTSQIKGATTKTLEFDNTTGAIAEVGYAISPKLWINVRYVAENYKANKYSVGSQSIAVRSAAIKGDHVGISASFQF